MIALAKDILWHWKTFPIVLPPPIETKLEPAAGSSATLRKKAISRTDLFIEPNFDEMRSIAFTSTGERKKLTKDQLESVRRSGEFEVRAQVFAEVISTFARRLLQSEACKLPRKLVMQYYVWKI